jgi:hypothetical protein
MEGKRKRNGCPFCGGSAVIATQGGGERKGYRAECLDCGAKGPAGLSTCKEGLNAWDHGVKPYERPFGDADKAPLPLHDVNQN